MAIFKKKKVDVSLTNGADLPNTNDQDKLNRLSLDEANNPLVQGEPHTDPSLFRQKGESQRAYNERIAPALQPVQPMPTESYLGKPL